MPHYADGQEARSYAVLAVALIALSLGSLARAEGPQPEQNSVLKPAPKTGYVQRPDLGEVAAARPAYHHEPVTLRLGMPDLVGIGAALLVSALFLCCALLAVARSIRGHGEQRCQWRGESAEASRRKPGFKTLAVLLLAIGSGGSALAGQPTGYVPREDLAQVVEMRQRMAAWKPPMRGSYPAKFRCQKYLGPVRSQANCGSCYVFGAEGAIEGALAKAGVLQPSEYFNPQYALDCLRVGGCGGGDPSRVVEIAMERGLPTEEDYGEYRARPGRCKGDTAKLYKISDWGFCDGGGVASTDSIKAAMIAHGPISACILADRPFMSYQKGQVFRGNARGVNHVVVLVGWDDSVGRSGAWLVRNSWSEEWGDQGMAWVEFGANNCGTAALWCHCEPASPPIVWHVWVWTGRFFLVVLVISMFGGAFVLGRFVAGRSPKDWTGPAPGSGKDLP